MLRTVVDRMGAAEKTGGPTYEVSVGMGRSGHFPGADPIGVWSLSSGIAELDQIVWVSNMNTGTSRSVLIRTS